MRVRPYFKLWKILRGGPVPVSLVVPTPLWSFSLRDRKDCIVEPEVKVVTGRDTHSVCM